MAAWSGERLVTDVTGLLDSLARAQLRCGAEGPGKLLLGAIRVAGGRGDESSWGGHRPLSVRGRRGLELRCVAGADDSTGRSQLFVGC